jgi:hypothetical protein
MAASPKVFTLSQVTEMLKSRQGVLINVAYAAKLGISPQFLSDIYRGLRGPSKEVLDTMGLQREIMYIKKQS